VVVLLPLALAAMFLISPVLAAWSLVPLVLLTLTTLLFSPRTRIHSQQVQERQSDLSARAQENFSGVRVVKAFGREQFEAEEFDALGRRLLESQLALARNRSAYQSLIWVLNGVGLLVFLFFGARQIAAGALSIGQFLEFNLFFVMLYWPMISLGWVIMLVVRGRVSARRINELLAEPPDPGIPGDPFAEPPSGEPRIRGGVEFRKVGFAYEAGTPVLTDVSFTVAPGGTIAIVGPVGCGKTTVAQLLMRLRGADSGSVLIDGRDIREYDAGMLRRQMGYVPQETFLFSESIRENVAFGISGTVGVEEASDIAQLSGEIGALPNGYDTVLGERGVNLSGGQKQRAAIARALAKRPAIMILDDCLSAVDTRTEDAILTGLKRALRDTTVVIIAQRVSTVAHADEIIVLDRGRVVERGNDRSLRAMGGLYASMAESQQLTESLKE
jgi:ATP-binding cassette subfamily B protein